MEALLFYIKNDIKPWNRKRAQLVLVHKKHIPERNKES